ncbi:MAG: two-component system chemotaxis sensor kinase CheA [Planctomycetota bacterium]|jgi:two-component system chemotaxis sensor kinase CheA
MERALVGGVDSLPAFLAALEHCVRAASDAQTHKAVTTQLPPSANETILCIEDDGDIALLVCCALTSNSVTVEVCSDGLEGWERLRSGSRPSVVLLDLMLPSLPGREILRRIRDSSQFEDLAVIVVSAGVLGDEAEQALLSGADAFLAKPFDVVDLQALVQKVVH